MVHFTLVREGRQYNVKYKEKFPYIPSFRLALKKYPPAVQASSEKTEIAEINGVLAWNL
jgi:hypothetical protein